MYKKFLINKQNGFNHISGRSQEYFQSTHGERADVVRQHDNLSLEGKHTMTKKDAAVYQGNKATVVKHADNLKVEGKFEGMEGWVKNIYQRPFKGQDE